MRIARLLFRAEQKSAAIIIMSALFEELARSLAVRTCYCILSNATLSVWQYCSLHQLTKSRASRSRGIVHDSHNSSGRFVATSSQCCRNGTLLQPLISNFKIDVKKSYTYRRKYRFAGLLAPNYFSRVICILSAIIERINIQLIFTLMSVHHIQIETE